MDREQQDEFYAVRESAYDALRLGTPIDRYRSVPMCQFLILPSFENPVSWDVIRVVSRKDGAQTRLYRSCWRIELLATVAFSIATLNPIPLIAYAGGTAGSAAGGALADTIFPGDDLAKKGFELLGGAVGGTASVGVYNGAAKSSKHSD